MKLLPRKMIVQGVNISEYEESGKNVVVRLATPITPRADDDDGPARWMPPDDAIQVSMRPSQVGKMPVVGQEVTVSIRVNWEGEDI